MKEVNILLFLWLGSYLTPSCSISVCPIVLRVDEIENKLKYNISPDEGRDQVNKLAKRDDANVEISYISSSYSVDILCRGNKSVKSLRVACSAEEGGIKKLDLESNTLKFPPFKKAFGHTSTKDEYLYARGVLSWKAFRNLSHFPCWCEARSQGAIYNAPSVDVVVKKFNNTGQKSIIASTNDEKYIQLKCYLHGKPKLNVTWIKNGKPLTINKAVDGTKYKLERQGRRLKISRSGIRGSGNYRCVGWNMAGKEWGQQYAVVLHRTKTVLTSNVTPFEPSVIRNTSPIKIVLTPNVAAFGPSVFQSTSRLGVGIVESIKNSPDDNEFGGKQRHKVGLTTPIILIVGGKQRHKVGLTTPIILIVVSVAVVVVLIVVVIINFSRKCTCSTVEDNENKARCLQRKNRRCSNDSNISTILSSLNAPPNVNPRYFASGLLDHNGGCIFMESTGIKLVIPEGAIPEGKTEAVYIAVEENNKCFPYLRENETRLTYVVMCGPHGLKFKKHVLLILPHWASSRKDVKNLRVLCSDTARDEDTDWKEVFNKQEESGENDVYCLINDNYISLIVPHFTLYDIPAECNSLQCALVIYRSKTYDSSGIFEIRIYCTPDAKKHHQDIEKMEKEKLNGVLCDAPTPITIYEGYGNLRCRHNLMPADGWEIISFIKKIDIAILWKTAETPPLFKCDLKFTGETLDYIYCWFRVYQEELRVKEDAQLTRNNLKCYVQFPSEKKVLPPSPSNSSLAGTSSGYQSRGGTTTFGVFPKQLKKNLARMLEGHALELAKVLGIQGNIPNGQNRVEYLLAQWEYAVAPGKSLREFAGKLTKWPDAQNEVIKYCPKETYV